MAAFASSRVLPEPLKTSSSRPVAGLVEAGCPGASCEDFWRSPTLSSFGVAFEDFSPAAASEGFAGPLVGPFVGGFGVLLFRGDCDWFGRAALFLGLV